MTESPIIYVIDDDKRLRKALTTLLELNGYRVKTYPDAAAFLDEPLALEAGCILLDVQMPGISGLKLQEELNQRNCPLPIVFLSGYGTPGTGFTAAKQGAENFLLKPIKNEALLVALRAAVEKSIARMSREQCLIDLTARQREIYELIEAGKNNIAIAETLGLSVKTVEFHKTRIRKLLAGKDNPTD